MFRRDIFPYPREKDMPSTYWFCLTVFGDETNAMLSHRQHVPGSCLCLKIWLLHWKILTFSYITQYIIFSRVWLPDCQSNELPSTPKLLKTANRKSQATCGTTWIREDWIFCALWALSKKSRDLISYPSCPKDMKWSWKSQWLPKTEALWELSETKLSFYRWNTHTHTHTHTHTQAQKGSDKLEGKPVSYNVHFCVIYVSKPHFLSPSSRLAEAIAETIQVHCILM